MPAEDVRQLTQDEAVLLAGRYIGAYNDRDLEGMLAVQDEAIASYPAPLFGRQPHTGHSGVRAWWKAMVASDRWYTVVVDEVRMLGPDRVAIIGEIRDGDEPVSPWAVLIRVRNGLIVESRSYLSDRDFLEQLGLLDGDL